MKCFIILLCYCPMTLMSQTLEDIRWQKRAIVIESPEFTNDQAREQVKLLEEYKNELEDYKLLIIERANQWERVHLKETTIYEKRRAIDHFKVFLIGLDGGVKYESNTVQSPQTFFDLINTMPMLRQELNKGS